MNSYIALDLETTGLDPKKDKIIEIGAVKVIDGEILEEFSTLINPRRFLEERITEITHISDEMLKPAPGIEEVLEKFLNFCGGLPILGHRVIFDYSFLKRAAVNLGYSFEKEGIDTLFLCRKFMPPEEKKNLTDAAAYFGIRIENAHRALEDAKTAHELYRELKRRYENPHPGQTEENETAFLPKPLIYKVKKEQPATKKQKEVLRDLIKYHKISLTVEIDYLTRNEASRLTDRIILQYGRMRKTEE